MSLVKRLSKINDRTKNSVYGWVHTAERELKLRHVPMMINSIFILYLHEDEKFVSVGDNINVSKDGKTITKGMSPTWDYARIHNISYGSIIINGNTTRVHKWTLKFSDGVFGHNCVLGITNAKDTRKYLFDQDKVHYYSVASDGTRNRNPPAKQVEKWKRASGFGDDDKVQLEFDPNAANLKFSVNGINQKLDFNQITLDSTDYRLFVILLDENIICDIEEFKSF